MYEREIELFWTVWPSDVASTVQMVRVIGADTDEGLAVPITPRKIKIGVYHSHVTVRPGCSPPADLVGACIDAWEAWEQLVGPHWAPMIMPHEPTTEQPCLDVAELVRDWPGDFATLAQLAELAGVNENYLRSKLVELGVPTLPQSVKLPTGKRSRVVSLRRLPPCDDLLDACLRAEVRYHMQHGRAR